MKYVNVILLALLCIFLFADDTYSVPFVTETPTNMAMYFELAAAHDDKSNDTVVECECGGDGDVGDGNIRVPCPCVQNGGTCNCPKSEPTIEEEVAIPANWAYAILFTNPEWCAPCVNYEDNVLSKLHSTWVVSTREGGYTHIVTADENSPLVEKYRAYLGEDFAMPTMILVKNGQVRWIGRGLATLPKDSTAFGNLFRSAR